MKTNRILIAAAVSLGLSMLASSALAQSKATGDDGIVASPKYRQVLNENATKPAAKLPKMACSTCRDEYATKTDFDARGANKPTILVARHLCDGCSNEVTVTGHGKSKETIVTHKCTTGKITNCCDKPGAKAK